MSKNNKLNIVNDLFSSLLDWLQPNPNDTLLLKIIKTFFKSIAALILILLSPIILIIVFLIFALTL